MKISTPNDNKLRRGPEGCHAGSKFYGNDIWVGSPATLDIGLHVAKHRWDINRETYYAEVFDNAISGAVINLMIDGHVGGIIKNNSIGAPATHFLDPLLDPACGTCFQDPYAARYTVVHTADACLQEEVVPEPFFFHGKNICGIDKNPVVNWCGNQALFSQYRDLPSVLDPGEVWEVKVILENWGEFVWTQDEKIKLASRVGSTWGVTRVYLPSSVFKVGRRSRSCAPSRRTICEKHDRWLPGAARSRYLVRYVG
ncbi:MAG: hypothetical protein K8R59_10020 [Thermoanaerobaculales bacterium]|nr:hypothetical protein [Thermoanaerobaculales bacterium]